MCGRAPRQWPSSVAAERAKRVATKFGSGLSTELIHKQFRACFVPSSYLVADCFVALALVLVTDLAAVRGVIHRLRRPRIGRGAPGELAVRLRSDRAMADAVERSRVSVLKEIITRAGMSYVGALERGELVALARVALSRCAGAGVGDARDRAEEGDDGGQVRGGSDAPHGGEPDGAAAAEPHGEEPDGAEAAAPRGTEPNGKRTRGERSEEAGRARQQKKRRRQKESALRAVERARESERARAAAAVEAERRRGEALRAREREQQARRSQVELERARQQERSRARQKQAGGGAGRAARRAHRKWARQRGGGSSGGGGVYGPADARR